MYHCKHPGLHAINPPVELQTTPSPRTEEDSLERVVTHILGQYLFNSMPVGDGPGNRLDALADSCELGHDLLVANVLGTRLVQNRLSKPGCLVAQILKLVVQPADLLVVFRELFILLRQEGYSFVADFLSTSEPTVQLVFFGSPG